MAIPDWLAIGSTVASPIISAVGAYVSWRVYSRQKADSKERTSTLERSLAPTLLGDVNTAIESLAHIIERSAQIKRISMSNANEALLVLRGLGGIRMPSVSDFKDQIISFDGQLADAILQASGCLDRVHHLIDGFLSENPSQAQLASAIAGVQSASPQALTKLKAAQRALIKVVESPRQ